MHLDPLTGLWKSDDNDYQPPKLIDEPDEEDGEVLSDITAPPPEFHGKCVLSVRFDSADDHARWNTYVQDRQWDFVVTYPAIMQATYNFHSSLEVDILAKKIIHLLQMGFDVYSASWKLEKKDEKK